MICKHFKKLRSKIKDIKFIDSLYPLVVEDFDITYGDLPF